MSAPARAPVTVRGALNFAADRTSDGIWSNGNRSLITQKLKAYEVELCDAKTLSSPTTLKDEGFELHHQPMIDPEWTNSDWIASVYCPRTLELVQKVTGAAEVALYYRGALIRDSGDVTRAPAAEFVHLDNSRESALPFLKMAADEAMMAKYPRIEVYNIWRVITPPPQDVPLALCDQRTLDERDWVEGRTVEPTFPDGVPYVTSVFNPAQRWFYFPDLTPDDVLIFKGFDNRPDKPFGCLHGAFRHPEVSGEGVVPRASIETRVFAFFEE